MGSKKVTIYLISIISFVTILLAGLIALYYYNIFGSINKNLVVYSSDFRSITQNNNEQEVITEDAVDNTEIANSNTNNVNVDTQISTTTQHNVETLSGLDLNHKDGIVVEVSRNQSSRIFNTDLSTFQFHAIGEFITEDEYNFRVSLIRSLSIRTVVIDSLTPGNGIAQEFYRTVYMSEMIPAKILDQIVESSQFRSLIPERYLSNESNARLNNGDRVTFGNNEIKDLLILWSMGRLIPYQKAWLSRVRS